MKDVDIFGEGAVPQYLLLLLLVGWFNEFPVLTS